MKHIFSVTQINSYIHRIFESDYALKKIYLKGEVSNCKYHSSGHIYFTLKDEKSALRCVMFSSDRYKGLTFHLEDGQLIEACGNISVYEQTGTYQMYVRKIELSGAGELYIRYEQLKQELAQKGYFDFERKKPLPPYPEKIGIVTALTGAAIEDIKSIAKRRNPSVQLYLYPSKVQGEGAAAQIARGIRYFDTAGVDIIIIGRGTSIFMGICAAAFLPAYFCALYWKKATKQGVMASLWVGTIGSLFALVFLHQKESAALGICKALFGRDVLITTYPFPVIDPILFALPLSVLAIIVISLITKK